MSYGLSKKHQWRRETLWWNNEVDEAIKEKRKRLKYDRALLKEGSDGVAEEARLLYNLAKRNANHVVWRTKSEKC